MLKVRHISFLAILGFLIFGPSTQNLSAQNVSVDGDFSLSFITGCDPLTVEVNNLFTGSVGSVLYYYNNTVDPETCDDFRNNPNACFNGDLTADTRFTFNEPGTYYVIQILATATGGRVDYIRVDVVDNSVPPAVTINNCEGNTVEVIFNQNSDPYDFYSINFRDGNTTIEETNWSGDNNYYYTFSNPGNYNISIRGHFENGNASSCVSPPNFVTAFESLPTPLLLQLSIENENVAHLEYEPLAQNLVYELLIDQGDGFEVLQEIDPSINETEIDLDLPNIDLTEDLIALLLRVTDNCGSASRNSEIAYSVASALTNQSVNENFQLQFTWSTNSTDFSELTLVREGQNLATFDQAQGSTDLAVGNCNQLTSYRFERNSLGISSLGPPMLPFNNQSLNLPSPEAPEAVVDGAVVELSFPQTYFGLGEYVLYRKDIDDNFNEIRRTNANALLDTTIPGGTGQVCYQLAYTDECGNISELSQEICLVLSTSLGVPNAFSPNGDNINDEFRIADGIYANFQMSIYSRWGTPVFSTTDPLEGWDGTFEGEPVKAGTYLFRISFENADNLPITRTGSFVLIR